MGTTSRSSRLVPAAWAMPRSRTMWAASSAANNGTRPETAGKRQGVQVVGVREADFVDLFVEQRERTPGVELLVRANRVLGGDDTDKLKVRKSPAQGNGSSRSNV